MQLMPNLSDDEAISIAMLLGWECWAVPRPGQHDAKGYRWNGGTVYGAWAPTQAWAARAFLNASDFNSALTRQYPGDDDD